jgi:hypothetical protein
VGVNDKDVVIGGTHDKTVTGAVTQIYGDNHKRKVDGEQELVEEKNKDRARQAGLQADHGQEVPAEPGPDQHDLQGQQRDRGLGGTITMTAGGATVCIDKTGNATFDSPTGIKLECGASSLTVLPGGIAIASPAVTAAAGAGSVMALGEAPPP